MLQNVAKNRDVASGHGYLGSLMELQCMDRRRCMRMMRLISVKSKSSSCPVVHCCNFVAMEGNRCGCVAR